MRTRFGVALFLIAAFVLPSDSSAQRRDDGPRLYRWVDKNGVVQYGDSIPPEYANADRDVLNRQGVRIGFEEGEITPEERVVLDERQAAADQRRQAQLEVARRDRMLLQAYSTVSDIVDLRDRRLELLESQIKVTELYLANLRKRLVGLQEEASAYRPYTTRSDAPQIPENLALDISRTTGSINVYEQTLSRTRADQRALRVSFDNDIERFKELKGG
ncbi:MAG TPA: DUF4124 domain-containing protein [Gammaproteobacteria bacterium]|nr:DUF4124 domain-containing protein [Gammaproteobacteria bacterium]